MSNRRYDEPSPEELAICPLCGKYRKLIDVREEAKKLGFSIQGSEPQIVIQCCGYQLDIDDDRVYKEVIAILQNQSEAK